MSRRRDRRGGRRADRVVEVVPLLRFSAGTFTRSSEASYYTQPIGGGAGSTFVAWDSSNVLRYDSVDGTRLALFEGSQSNLCPYSEDLNQTAWAKTGASISGTTGTAPDGASDLCTVDFTASASDSIMQTISTGTADNTLYIATAFVRRTSGSGDIRFQLVNRANVTSQSSDIAIDTTWKRIEWRVNWGTGATSPQIGLINGTSAAAQSVEVWGFDVKASPATIAAPTSYIRTTATSATRAADSLTYTSMPTTMASGRWRFDFRPTFANTESTASVHFGMSNSANSWIGATSTNVNASSAGLTSFQRTGLTWGRNAQMLVIPDCSAFTMTVVGATSGNGTGVVGSNPAYATTYLRVGGTFNGSAYSYARLGEPYAAT